MANRTVSESRFAITSGTQKSLSFNGTSDYATVPILPDTTGFNISFWFKWRTQAINQRVLDSDNGAITAGFMLSSTTVGKLELRIWDGGGQTVSITTNNLDIGKWYHLTLTFKPNETKMYVNGVQVGSTDTSCAMGATNQVMTLCRAAPFAVQYADCILKNYTQQNTATPWTQAQVYALYFRNEIPSGAKQWSFNNVATDQNGENALTLTGTSYSTDVPGHMTARSTATNRFAAPTTQQYSLNFSAASDRVAITTVTAQNNLHTTTISYWAKLNALTAGSAVNFFNKGTDNTIRYLNHNIYNRVNFYTTAEWSAAQGKWAKYDGWQWINFLQWHHYLWTYDDSSINNNPTLYIDGIAVTTPNKESSPSGNRTAVDGTGLWIGNSGTDNFSLRGKMYDFRLFSRVVTADEIDKIRKNIPVTSGLVGHWKLNEGSGSTAIDSTGNANGTITGATYSTDTPFGIRSAV